ncbi:hypothetical protein SELSPUOL_02674 [Selenomonas sputigena ATCC 35185]|uniref:Uncharacterized protein n=1 Tax=Selenomonas sputigena (strain ATCC 35185 / DSM 20758 / CCUG 44933 / VPI D19B-28) TaxID=546271 RepID=C9LYW4_SELS3|nr:hypothetical protein SELSPUOL_02674 [Selenomonas sputigena ATCC 35185]
MDFGEHIGKVQSRPTRARGLKCLRRKRTVRDDGRAPRGRVD